MVNFRPRRSNGKATTPRETVKQNERKFLKEDVVDYQYTKEQFKLTEPGNVSASRFNTIYKIRYNDKFNFDSYQENQSPLNKITEIVTYLVSELNKIEMNSRWAYPKESFYKDLLNYDKSGYLWSIINKPRRTQEEIDYFNDVLNAYKISHEADYSFAMLTLKIFYNIYFYGNSDDIQHLWDFVKVFENIYLEFMANGPVPNDRDKGRNNEFIISTILRKYIDVMYIFISLDMKIYPQSDKGLAFDTLVNIYNKYDNLSNLRESNNSISAIEWNQSPPEYSYANICLSDIIDSYTGNDEQFLIMNKNFFYMYILTFNQHNLKYFLSDRDVVIFDISNIDDGIDYFDYLRDYTNMFNNIVCILDKLPKYNDFVPNTYAEEDGGDLFNLVNGKFYIVDVKNIHSKSQMNKVDEKFAGSNYIKYLPQLFIYMISYAGFIVPNNTWKGNLYLEILYSTRDGFIYEPITTFLQGYGDQLCKFYSKVRSCSKYIKNNNEGLANINYFDDLVISMLNRRDINCLLENRCRK